MLKDIINKMNSSKLFKNILILFKGNVVVSILSFINMSILINILGLEQNGIIFIAQSYVLLFNDLLSFKSINSIIKFVPRYLNKDANKVVWYIKQGLIFDYSTAIISIIIAIIVLNPISYIMKWDREVISIITMLLITIIFKATGTMLGILRIYDKFKETVYANLGQAITKLVLYIIGFFIKANIYYFVFVEVISTMVMYIVIIFFTFRTLKLNKLSLIGVNCKIDKEFLIFNIYSNLQLSLDLPLVHLTPFIINSTLGYTQISVYKVIEKVGTLITQVTSPINQAIYPNLSEIISSKNVDKALGLHKKLKKNLFLIGGLGCVIISLSSIIWIGILMPRTLENIFAIFLYLVFVVYTNMYMILHPMFMFLGYIKYNIPIILFANIIYIIILFGLASTLGVIGVIIAKFIQAILVVVLKEYILKKNKYQELRV